jgi:superfamily II DNA or RNA helicase
VIDYPAIYRLLTIGDPADMRGMQPESLVEYDRLSTVAARSPKPLRRWQAEAMPRALAALECSLPGVVVATTGAGKSVFLAELIRCWRTTHPDDVIVVTTPSVQLVEQLGTTLADWLGPGIVGRYYTKAKQWKRPVVVACNASVPVLATVLAEHGRAVGVWVADECFPAGTLIRTTRGLVAIENITTGTMVESFDPLDGILVTRMVTTTMRRISAQMVTVVMRDGERIDCTSCHPFLTDAGWVDAIKLAGRAIVRYGAKHDAINLRHVRNGNRNAQEGDITTDVLRSLQGRTEETKARTGEAGAGAHMPGMRGKRSRRMVSGRGRSGSPRDHCMLGDVQETGGPTGSCPCHVQPTTWIGTNAGEQPDAARGVTPENVGDTSAHRPSTATWWKRNRRYSAANTLSVCAWVADRGSREHQQEEGAGVSAGIQGRHRIGGLQVGDRDRRGVALHTCEQGEGCEEGRVAAWARVDRVEVHEQTGGVGTGSMCRGREVYNFEVDGTHTYILGSGLVVHNCHKTASDAFLAAAGETVEPTVDAEDVADVLQSARRLGLTATPFRSNVDERIGLFSEVVYRYSPADALRDGVIVPWRFVQADEEGKDVDAACIEMIRALGSREERGPGVVDATSIEDATAYAATLTAAGIVAREIHSRQPDGTKAAAIEALRTGQIDCIVHVSMLVEGVDLPWLRWGCFRRPVGARVRYIQHLGRYLRAFAGKTEAVILDPCGLEQRFRVTYEEALGWTAPVEVEEVAEVEPEDDDPTKEAPDKEPREVLTARVHSLALYVRRLTGALVAEGIAEKGDRKPGSWRNDAPSDKQRTALAKMVRVSARLGPAHRAALGRLSGSPVLTKGLASDVFDLLQAVRSLKGGEVWTPAVPVPVPADHVYEAPERPTFVGAALADGWAAVAIIADGDVLYQGARGQREGDTLEALYVRAEVLARTTHGATIVRRAPGAVQAADRAIAAKVGAPLFRGAWVGVGG